MNSMHACYCKKKVEKKTENKNCDRGCMREKNKGHSTPRKKTLRLFRIHVKCRHVNANAES